MAPTSRTCLCVAYDESFEITALAPLGDRVLAAVWDYRPWLAIFDMVKGERLSLQKTTCDYPITALASFDKDTFAAGCKDGAIEMWDAMMHWQVGKHAECVTALAALPDGRLVSGSADHTVCTYLSSKRLSMRSSSCRVAGS